MANEEHLAVLGQGVSAWNDWREKNPEILLDLSAANVAEEDLSQVNLSRAELRKAVLPHAQLHEAHLNGAQRQGTKNLTIEQLAQAKALYGAKLDEPLMRQVQKKYPQLLEKPKD